ncbi:metallo-beta-lactamase class B VIM [Litorimonas taeanensis]|uniref:beta-lactamase n=1 Tax=Litorimonas taeanensis TaxID=568099 RepID=A0A420WJ88_9PROT|nr:subclass B1 metallo-beta-lactamase [Litorimonas taeanensis]RKQ70992.1 metallo-beta-lactamase class B VIM [Litorimonas taeanensis]
MRFSHFVLIGLSASLAACGAESNTSKPSAGPDNFLAKVQADYPVTLSNIAENVWVHTSNYRIPGQQPIPVNGLVVVDGDDVILVDAAWGELATVSLLEKVKQEIGKPVTKLIITHHHADRVMGVDAAEREGIQVFTHPDTPALAASNGWPVPNTSVSALKEKHSRTKVGAVEIAYPGHGHASDNLVVYIPAAHVLYGGCAVRGAETNTLGNTNDADLKEWAASLSWVKATYPEAVLVVPGHGKGADLSLIDKTLGMIANAVNSQKANSQTAD